MKNLLTLSVLTLILSSCSGGSSSGSSANPTNQPISNPAGSAYGEMIPNKFYVPLVSTCTLEGSFYFKELFSKANDEFLHIKEYYSDSLCSNTLFYASKIYIFASYVPMNSEQLTSFSLIDAQLSIVDSAFLQTYNDAVFYGFNDWTLGNPKSLIDRRPQPSAPVQFITGSISDYLMRTVSGNLLINGIQYQ